MSLGSVIGGVVGGLMGGSSSDEVEQTTKVQPAKREDWAADLLDLWTAQLFGSQGAGGAGAGQIAPGTAPSPVADMVGQSGQPMSKELQWLYDLKAGKSKTLRPREGGGWYYDPTAQNYEGSPDLPVQWKQDMSWRLASGQANIDDLIAERVGYYQMASGQPTVAGAGGRRDGMGQPVGEPSIFDKIKEQQQWLRQQHDPYQQALTRTSQGVQDAINHTAANPINLAFKGQQLGGLPMMGGVKLADMLRQEQMLGPTEKWNYANQNPIYSGDMRAFDFLRDIFERSEDRRYQTATTQQTTSANYSPMTSIGAGWELGNKIYDSFNGGGRSNADGGTQQQSSNLLSDIWKFISGA